MNICNLSLAATVLFFSSLKKKVKTIFMQHFLFFLLGSYFGDDVFNWGHILEMYKLPNFYIF